MSANYLSNGYLVSQLAIIALGFWSLVAKENPEPYYLVRKSLKKNFDSKSLFLILNRLIS